MNTKALYDNEAYYNQCCNQDGSPYSDFKPFFHMIAQRLFNDFSPKTVLDVGCAYGYLVAELRDLGVKAYGIDISDYAIEHAREDIHPYLAAQSATEPLPETFPQSFDLVISIEMIEHMYAEDGDKTIARMCKYGDIVILSSTFDDIDNATHFNVQQPEYWAKRFARHGFFIDHSKDVTYISKAAVCFFHTTDFTNVVEDYERYIRIWKSTKAYGPEILSKIYFDCGNGESEELSKSFMTVRRKTFSQTVTLPPDCRRIRFDPIEGYGSMVEVLDVRSNTSLLNCGDSNGIRVNNRYLFSTLDPQIYIDIPKDADTVWISITAEITPMEQVSWLPFCNDLTEWHENTTELLRLKQRMEEVSKEQQENALESAQLKSKISDYEKNRKVLEAQLADLEQFLGDVDTEKERLYADIKKLKKEISDYSNLVAYERAQSEITNHKLTAIQNSQFWRMTKPMRRTLDVIKGAFHRTKIAPESAAYVDDIQTSDLEAAEHEEKKTWKLKTTCNPVEAIDTIIISDSVKRLNLVTDSLDSNSLLGGVATALVVATLFANKFDYELRIITRQADINPLNYENIMKTSGIEPARRLSFYSDYQRSALTKNYKMELSPSDIFFATSWWSAKAIEETSLLNHFFYIIQEVETFFYNFGDEHLLCSQEMHRDNINYIVNSSFLYNYFKEHEPNIAQNGVCFEPAFPASLYQQKELKSKRKYKLFFYARPNNPRNLFSFGVEMINKAIENGILDCDAWDIYFAGQEVPDVVFSNGYVPKAVGQMSWNDYAAFLSDVDIGLCLMYTPHPSYPPFDVACSGGVVLTNKAFNKTEFQMCKNVIMSDLDESAFLSSFRDAVKLAKDNETRQKNYLNSTIPRDWNETLKDTIAFMKEKISNA